MTKRSGPLYTLLAGFVLAAAMLSLNVTTGSGVTSYSGGTAPATPGTAPTPTPTVAGPSATAPPDADYAGRTADRAASVAVSLRGGKAVAYVCDGRTKEAWLRGDVKDDGTMRLTGKRGAGLDGTLRGGRVSGAVHLPGRVNWAFSADKAVKPSGLYRATAVVRGARVEGGWIVQRSGSQVGIVDRDGVPSGAPFIDPATGAVTVDGRQLTAKPIGSAP
jgi:hypothetical protein